MFGRRRLISPCALYGPMAGANGKLSNARIASVFYLGRNGRIGSRRDPMIVCVGRNIDGGLGREVKQELE